MSTSKTPNKRKAVSENSRAASKTLSSPQPKMSKQKKSSNDKYNEILPTLGDFTSRENWDKFFTIRGTEDSFEWYAEWPNLKTPLLPQLSTFSNSNRDSPVQILIPGCGSSKLSENLYDEGFHGITNIDFSKVVISDMLRRNIRERPVMKWRVMDMTHMQFTDGTFDAVVDKGGLDALMEPKLGPKLATQYVSEVKRVIKPDGKFICLTLAESHVLGLLFSKFRFGWKMSFHTIPDKPSNKKSLQTFMVVIEKDRSTVLHQITSMFDHSSLKCDINQGSGLIEALETENKTRSEYLSGADNIYSLEDLHLGVVGDLKELTPGRRLQLNLGEDGQSFFSYKAVLLDAQKQSEAFVYHCGVFIVPKTRSQEWLFSSEEGQWLVVESSKAARLIVVLLDSRHSGVNIDDIQDLSPLVKGLAPGEIEDGPQIPFMMANDGVKQRNIVHQVNSAKSGPIIVEDVIYENVDGPLSTDCPVEDLTFRRLTFERSLGLVQSEAVLTREECSPNNVSEVNNRKTNSTAKSKIKVNQKRSSSSVPMVHESKNLMKVEHKYLASSYHAGIISGFMLVSSRLQSMSSSGKKGKTVVIGLGAGLLPMFLRVCMPCLDVEVVELDSVVVTLARDYFGFIEDKQLKVHVSDGIEFVREAASAAAISTETVKQDNNSTSLSKEKLCPSNGNGNSLTEGEGSTKIDVLIIDVDSSDSSSGMSCPHPDFVEDSFLGTVKDSLSDGGLFVVNLVSRSPAIKDAVVSRIKVVFDSLFCLELEEDVNMILFALPMETCSTDDGLAVAASEFQKLLKLTDMEGGRSSIIMDSTKKIKRLK